MKNAYAAVLTLFLGAWSPIVFAQAPDAAKIDALFAQWDKPDAPGAALAVIKDGKIVYRRGYGMADIERGAPITPSTPFHVASLSKQFTAFAIHLLAQDGKLGLDDDIRKHLPELHDHGTPITIRQLIHHTSGLRDQWNLLAMGGWRLEDVITDDDVLHLVRRQKTLNFTPGAEYAYSNTGYTLLGQIVKRVAGKSLAAFTRERMFEPLGMRNTHFHEDYRALVKGRASSYEAAPDGGHHYIALSYSSVGPSSLFTTADDLALWDQNFYDARVGGKELIARVQAKGKLANGNEIAYGAGLGINAYRGVNVVEHSGGDAGFRSNFMRFPSERFSVVVLGNTATMNAGDLARKVADLYLGAVLKPQAAMVKNEWVEVPVDPARLDALVGDYALSPEFVIAFTKENGVLMAQATGQPKFPLSAANERTFFLKVVDAQFTFDLPGADGVVRSGVLHQNGRDQPAKRVARAVYPADLDEREGEFYSDELHVLYTVTQKDGKLVVRHPRGEMDLNRVSPDGFAASFPIGKLQYTCSAVAGCNSFTVSNGRVRNLLFTRVALKPVTARAGAVPAQAAAAPASPSATN